MSIEATIWVTDADGEDSTQHDGDIYVEVTGDEEVLIHFRVKGSSVATAEVDRFLAGILVGHITAGAVEAVKA